MTSRDRSIRHALVMTRRDRSIRHALDKLAIVERYAREASEVLTAAKEPAKKQPVKEALPQAHEEWATMVSADQFSRNRPRICLWGDEASARENCDSDERVCRVRVEVLEA